MYTIANFVGISIERYLAEYLKMATCPVIVFIHVFIEIFRFSITTGFLGSKVDLHVFYDDGGVLGFYGVVLSLPMICFRFLWCHIKFAYDVFKVSMVSY